MKIRILISALGVLFLTGCSMIEYHPYDAKIDGEKEIHKKNIARIEESCKDKTTFRFAWIGDSQRWYDETEDFVKVINARNDIDFVMHGGDQADFGLTKEFEWTRNILNKLKVPYVIILGNHDSLGNGNEVYAKMYGKENFSFIAGRVKFVCLNTNALEYDYSHPVPDFGFIKEEFKNRETEFDRTICAMHTRPFAEQFNNNVSDVFHEYIRHFPDLICCLYAHEHQYNVSDLFEDGILYIGCSCMQKRSYVLFTITPDGYEFEEVAY